MQRALGFGVCLLLLLAGACGDDATPSKAPKDAGDDSDKEKDADVPGMRIPTAGRSGGAGSGAGGSTSAIDESAYMCKPRAGDVGGAAESGADCCGGLGTCSAGLGESGLPHASCKANPDLRCLPKPVQADSDAGTGTPASCRVQLPGSPPQAASYEGRCLPNCFVSASPILSVV